MNTPISFELAKLLKEKGFNVPSEHYYEYSLSESYNEEDGYSGPFGWKKGELNYQKGFHQNNSTYDYSSESWFLCSAPTITDVVMWLYEKHGIWISVDWMTRTEPRNSGLVCYLRGVKKRLNPDNFVVINNIKEPGYEVFKSPTESYEAALVYVLNNLI